MASEPAALWRLTAAVGLAMAVVGWTDVGLLWYPLHLGDPEWEFGTISACLDGMPLGTIGLGLLAAGAIGCGWRWPTRAIAVASGLVTVGTFTIAVIYLLDVPVALRGTAPPVRTAIEKAMLKAGVFSMTYLLFYTWLAWFLWRRTRLVKE